jgi:SprT protein
LTVPILLQLKVQDRIKQCLDILLGEETAKYVKVQVQFKKTLGLNAGLAYNGDLKIVLNESLFLANQEEFFEEIIPHETAHIVQYILYPDELVDHGVNWKNLMLQLGLKPNVYHDLDISAVDKKVYRYTCCCSDGRRYHQIPEVKHKQLQQGKVLKCGGCSTRVIYFPRTENY